MKKLSLEWRLLDRKHAALVFDEVTWAIYRDEAGSRGEDTREVILNALSKLTPANNLRFDWRTLDGGLVALVFDEATFQIYQNEADHRGEDTCEMIAKAVTGVLGEIHRGRVQ